MMLIELCASLFSCFQDLIALSLHVSDKFDLEGKSGAQYPNNFHSGSRG